MKSVNLDPAVLPTPLPDGQFRSPEKVFSVVRLEPDETGKLASVVRSLINQSTEPANQANWDIQTQHLLHVLPWLTPWAVAVDDFLSDHGESFMPPVYRDEGFSLKVFLSRASEDHMDLPRFWPAALSIGLVGTRELVGIVQPSPEEAVELAAKLLRDGKELRSLSEIAGIPVERHTQRPGDVVTIGNFATLHSGFPLERSAALAIATRNRQEGGDPQYIINHYREFYPGVV